jgi:hypothetical protein
MTSDMTRRLDALFVGPSDLPKGLPNTTSDEDPITEHSNDFPNLFSISHNRILSPHHSWLTLIQFALRLFRSLSCLPAVSPTL